MRVLTDANAADASLNLEYLDWQAKPYLPDTNERQFLGRWGTIFLVNADGSRGRKLATFARGTAQLIATAITVKALGAHRREGSTVQTPRCACASAGVISLISASENPPARSCSF